MKILFVHDHRFFKHEGYYYSSGGLPSKVWRRYLSAFENLTVVGRDGGELSSNDSIKDTYSLSSEDNVNFELLPNNSNIKSFLFGDLETKKSTKELILRHDALIARLPSQLGKMFVKEAIKQDKAYAIEVVGCPWDSYWNYGNLKGKLVAPIEYITMRRIVKRADFVLYVTKFFLQNRYPSRGQAVNASNVEIEATPSEIVANKVNELQRVKDFYRIGLMGSSNVKYKGHEEILRAIALIKNNIPNIKLELTGSGETDWIMKLATELNIESMIIINGKIPSGTPVLNWLDTLDLYVHPSKQEGLPRSVVEAMSRGCPVLASSVAGIPELINLEYLHKPGDYKKLAKDLKKVLNNKNILMKMSMSNHQKSKEYNKNILDNRRKHFWSDFAGHIKSLYILF